MNFNTLSILVLFSLPVFSYEISIKRNNISKKKFNLINEARALTLEQKKTLFKNSKNYSEYKNALNEILQKRKKETIKSLLYSKAIQDKANKMRLKVFNQKRIKIFNEVSRIENQVLTPLMNTGLNYHESQEQLIKNLKNKGYPIDETRTLSSQYHELKDLIRQEYIEKIRDEETAKAEYLIFHPKAKPNYFAYHNDIENERVKLRAIFPENKNSYDKYVFYPEQVSENVMNAFYYFSPQKVSLFDLPKSVYETNEVELLIDRVISLYLSSVHKPVSIKKQRIIDLKNTSAPEKIFLKELYTFLLNNRKSTSTLYQYLKNVRETFLKHDAPLSKIIPPKEIPENMKTLIYAFAEYLSSTLTKVLVVDVSTDDINSSDTFLKVEKKVNELKFLENRNNFIKYKLPRFLNYVHIRDGYKRLDAKIFFNFN
jgi:hypothetical protein